FLTFGTHLWLERLVEELLGNPEAVGLCRIEKVDSKIKRRANSCLVGGEIQLAPLTAKGPGAKADCGDAHAGVPEFGKLHRRTSFLLQGSRTVRQWVEGVLLCRWSLQDSDH